MGRILAIDYGKKRVGLAVTDENRIIANALDTVPSHEIFAYLKQYCGKEAVDVMIVGSPMRMHHVASEIEPQIQAFVKALKNAFPLMLIERHDERFTSKMAFNTMLESGINKTARRDKALIDRISATIILQSYMDFIEQKKNRS